MFLKILYVKVKILIFLTTLLLYVTIVHQLAHQCLQCGKIVKWGYTCYKIRAGGYESLVPTCQTEINSYTEIYTEAERLILEVGLAIMCFSTKLVIGTLLNIELVDIAVDAIIGIIHVIEADET